MSIVAHPKVRPSGVRTSSGAPRRKNTRRPSWHARAPTNRVCPAGRFGDYPGYGPSREGYKKQVVKQMSV